MGIIEIKDMHKAFGSLQVFKGLNLNVEKGEVISIIGGSGCGKSVMLRSIEMLEVPDSGQIFINGEEITAKGADIAKIRRGIGMVYQDFGLFSNMNVIENLTIAPIKLLGMEKAEAEAKAIDLLKMVGIADWASSSVKNLSGGQKQRVAICRCMMMDPQIILFDEPTSALDPTMVGEVLATIRMLAKRGLTMMIVTHEMNFAKQIANRVIFLADGGIYEDGTPEEIFDHPKKEKTIAFIRKLKFFNYHIENKDFDLMSLQGGIINFSVKYGLSANESYRLQMCTEEMIYELINGCYANENNLDIDIEIAYSESDKNSEIKFVCGGSKYNPFEAISDNKEILLDHLGLAIIDRKSSERKYEYKDGKNEIFIKL